MSNTGGGDHSPDMKLVLPVASDPESKVEKLFNAQEKEELSDLYDKIVSFGGPIDLKHFKTIVKVLYKDKFSKRNSFAHFVETIFHFIFDRGHDGIIDKSEWISGLELYYRVEKDKLNDHLLTIPDEKRDELFTALDKCISKVSRPQKTNVKVKGQPSHCQSLSTLASVSKKRDDKMERERLQKLAHERMCGCIHDSRLFHRLWNVVRVDLQLLKGWSEKGLFSTAKLISITKAIADIKDKGHISNRSVNPVNLDPHVILKVKSTTTNKPKAPPTPRKPWGSAHVSATSGMKHQGQGDGKVSKPTGSEVRGGPTKSKSGKYPRPLNVSIPPPIIRQHQGQGDGPVPKLSKQNKETLLNMSKANRTHKSQMSLHKRHQLMKAYGLKSWPF